MASWQRQTCGQCGCEFQYSRTEPKPIPVDRPVFCEGCAEYARGWEDGNRAGRDEWHRWRLEMAEARKAIGEGWFAGGVDLAAAIKRKVHALELDLELSRDGNREASVYGAMVAIQVRDHMREGRGAPDEDDMARFAEEAKTVAEMAREAAEPRSTPPRTQPGEESERSGSDA